MLVNADFDVPRARVLEQDLRNEAVAALAMIAYTCDTTDPSKEAAHLRYSGEILPRLEELGARPTVVGGCTAQDTALYSHRRDGRTGRQGGAVAIVPAA